MDNKQEKSDLIISQLVMNFAQKIAVLEADKAILQVENQQLKNEIENKTSKQ